MKALNFVLLFGVRCPRFAAVKESADYAGVVHCHLGWSCQLWVVPDAGGEASLSCSYNRLAKTVKEMKKFYSSPVNSLNLDSDTLNFLLSKHRGIASVITQL